MPRMTAASPVPVHPRLGVRMACRLQRVLRRPIDHRRWGQSSWLNYWQGRDEGLWTSDEPGPGDRPSPALGSS